MHVHLLFGQRVGDRGSAGWRSVGAEDLPADAGAEAGPFHASPAEAAGGADEDHGQRGHLLHAAHALYLHLQVVEERGRDQSHREKMGEPSSSSCLWRNDIKES